MSETFTGSPAGTTYGTYAAAVIYIDSQSGAAYRAWELRSVSDRKRDMLTATRYLDRQLWLDAYDTFTERDAYVLADAITYPFVFATYELAAMIAADASVVTKADQGSNIARVYAGGAGVDFFNPTSLKFGSADKLPPILMALIGSLLAGGSAAVLAAVGPGVAGEDDNPLSDCEDFDRGEPH